jgi:hypothetical protein
MIPLTDRAPVCIDESEWTKLAGASMEKKRIITEIFVLVKGETYLVWGRSGGILAGHLAYNDASLISTIEQVARDLGQSDGLLARLCIQDLPAENI